MFGLMDGERMSGASDSTGMENSSFSANISTYLAIIAAIICFIVFLILCIIF
jgi:preprotein translocase subunit SecG